MTQNKPRCFKLNWLTATLCMGLGGFGLSAVWSSNVAAQGVDAAAPTTAHTLGTVIVTGTRANNRSVADSESPIDVLTSADLQSTGSQELSEVLARLLPSMNFPRPSATDATDAIRPAQLRGLSPDQTLVLIDGKRRHSSAVVNVNGSIGRGSAPVDLNAIPLAQIERVEVLRDGAAAQYGSDAIAGVINIILKKGLKGGVAQVGYGEYAKGDGAQKTLATNFGTKLTEQGWARLTLDTRQQDYTNRADADLRDSREPRYGQVNQRYGDPDSQQLALAINSGIRLSDTLEFYGFANLSRRKTSAAALWRPAFSSTTSNTLNSPLYPEGYLPLENSLSTDQSIVTGLRGQVLGWRWDTSLNYGENIFDMNLSNTANRSLGAASQTDFYAGTLKNAQTVFNLDASKTLDVNGLEDPLLLSVGAEARRESYTILAGEAASYTNYNPALPGGSQGFGGFRPSDAGKFSRQNQALYADLEAQLNKQWSAGLALRQEHYSDFGNATSGKLSSRYALTPAVAVRATVSNGFRAPSLAQENYTITGTNSLLGQLYETGTFGVNTAAAKALGAEPLKAEKSRNFSIGTQIQPSPYFTTTIDAYQIDIDDRILLSSNLSLPTALQNALSNQGIYVQQARYFNNALNTRTKGVDVVSTYKLDLSAAGQVDLTFGYSYNQTRIRSVADNPAFLTQYGLTLMDKQTLERATRTAPKNKFNLGATYSYANWTLRTLSTWYGSFVVPQNDPSLDQTFGSKWLHDLSVGYRYQKWNWTLGIDNLTNEYPDRTLYQARPAVTLPYTQFSPFGFNGRFYYARATYTW